MTNTLIFILAVILGAATLPSMASAQSNWVGGIRLRVGWKYDNLRMCGATPPRVPHGPDIDISIFGEFPLFDQTYLDVNIPILRPIMFAAAARMIQFEPEATLLLATGRQGATSYRAGPSLGVSLHYGPDLNTSFASESGNEPFWAIGPRLGGYVGIDFARPRETFNYQLGIHPYVTPLFVIGKTRHFIVETPPQKHGTVAGITLDSSFRFHSEQQ